MYATKLSQHLHFVMQYARVTVPIPQLRRGMAANFQPQRGPGPLPLGDKAQQREMDELIKNAQARFDVFEDGPEAHPDAEKEPLQVHPDGVNPQTGEVNGPKGPEPTRYGDWERKGRVYDF